MDKVLIEQLVIDAYIGVYDWEHEAPQPLVFDIAMAWNNKPAAETDDIAFALDYDHVSQALQKLVQERPRQLIETIAEEAAALIQTEFKVTWVKIRVGKPQAVTAARTVAVEIERGSE